MFGNCSRSLVKGFLRAQGTALVNGDENKIVLTGWGLGNWLLPEGYMWLAGEGNRFDRPRRIEQVIRELTGETYAREFWQRYRQAYVCEADIAEMAALGYNSVRIPINWRVLMEDAPGVRFIKDGFRLLDNCIDWCEKYGLYAFLDLHAAPGGQTGANIDDSVDDRPRLFTDAGAWEQAIALWKELARRYRDRWIVGGYDLLNEPIRPGLSEGKALDPYLPRLVEFYRECIAEIRRIDRRHLLSIEGSHWATDVSIFHQRFDDNAVLHFHRYACMPGKEALDEFTAAADRMQIPLWLGETGENIHEWFAAMYPLCVLMGIGYNLWPWKKMACENSPVSICKPDGWDEIIAYTHGGTKPSAAYVTRILETYLHNIRIENCRRNPGLTNAVFRKPGFSLRGTDFDELPGEGCSYYNPEKRGNLYYRSNTQMDIVLLPGADDTSRFAFDSGWDRLALRMTGGTFSSYYIQSPEAPFHIRFSFTAQADTQCAITWQGEQTRFSAAKSAELVCYTATCKAGAGSIRLEVESGALVLSSLEVIKT